ncbi:MAG: hypothetical protein ABTQ26_01015, partial [Azonexus sp.]
MSGPSTVSYLARPNFRSWPGAPVGLLAPKRPYPGQARPRLTAYGRYVELKLPAMTRHSGFFYIAVIHFHT